MRHVRWLLVVLLTAGGASCRPEGQAGADVAAGGASAWELKPPTPDAVPVAARSRLKGIYPAGSRIADEDAPGGFGPSDNYPKDLTGKDWGTKGAISLVAFPDEPVAYFKYRGIALRLVNRTGEVSSFSACDSCLYIVQEAVDAEGRWREIESPPEAICGNSFHRVFLKPDQYWEFPARLYRGPIQTKCRFRLDPTGEEDREKPIYSNEFEGQVAAVQFRAGPDRASVRHALRSSDPKATGAVPVLAEALKDEDPATRRSTAMKLAEFGPAAKEAVPALLAAMRGTDSTLQATAAYALWRVSNEAKDPVATLIAVLGDKDHKESRWEAALWLHKMGPPAKEAVPALCAALSDQDDRLRSKVAEALGAIHSQAELAVPALVKSLDDPDWLVRCYAGKALGEFGPEARKAVLPLSEALTDRDGHVKVAAALALWKIEGKTDPAVPVLIQTLNGEDARSYSPEAAAEALGEIGPPAEAAIPDLTAALKHDSRGLRIAAAGALWKITKKPEPAVSVFIKALQDRDLLDDSDTARALDVLEEMGPQAKEAVPALLAVHKRGGSLFRESVEKTLKRIDGR
jgi:HEAT repeat protein